MPIVQLPHRPTPRRLRAVAVLAALALHVGAVLLVPFPVRSPRGDPVTLFVPVAPEDAPPQLVAPAATALTPIGTDRYAASAADAMPDGLPTAGAPGTSGGLSRPTHTGANPFLPDRPAASPSAGMAEARAAALPLVVRPEGGLGTRRLERTAEQLAIARAESLLVARLAGIAVVERRDTGAVGLANGGVTVAIPWGGFLPADRGDEEWRENRCTGGGGDSDKAGEGEARRAQCD